MGVFDFLKKKQSDLPVTQSLDNDALSPNLPSIDGGNLSLPELNSGQSPLSEPQSISFNVPTLDFSMPALDEPAQNVAVPTASPTDDVLSADDLNRLFPSDDWKEPDFTNFEPYPEDKIEQPKPEDFGVTSMNVSGNSDLPSFDEDGTPVPEKTVDVKRAGPKPVQLYVRGKSYNKVFVEIEQISRALQRQDSKLNVYEEIIKREEPLIVVAKEQTEYLFRKLNQVDKKIFVS